MAGIGSGQQGFMSGMAFLPPVGNTEKWITLGDEKDIKNIEKWGIDNFGLDTELFTTGRISSVDDKGKPKYERKPILEALDNTTSFSEMAKPFIAAPIEYYTTQILGNMIATNRKAGVAERVGAERLINTVDLAKWFNNYILASMLGKGAGKTGAIPEEKTKYEGEQIKILEKYLPSIIPEIEMQMTHLIKSREPQGGYTPKDLNNFIRTYTRGSVMEFIERGIDYINDNIKSSESYGDYNMTDLKDLTEKYGKEYAKETKEVFKAYNAKLSHKGLNNLGN